MILPSLQYFFEPYLDFDRHFGESEDSHWGKKEFIINDNRYELTLALPGIKADQLKLDLCEELNGWVLRVNLKQDYKGIESNTNKVYSLLGKVPDESGLSAKLEDGILRVLIPVKKPRTIPINL